MASNSTDDLCLQDRRWYVFLASSLIVCFGGVLLILLWRLLSWLICLRRSRSVNGCGSCDGCRTVDTVANPEVTPGVEIVGGKRQGSHYGTSFFNKTDDINITWVTEAKDWAGELISGQTLTGRILVLLVFLLSIASLGIYIFEATIHPKRVENCTPWLQDVLQQVSILSFLL